MAYVWCCGAEGCQPGTVNKTGHTNSIVGTVATETSIVRYGGGSMKITAAGAGASIQAVYTNSGTTETVRGYFRHESLPTSAVASGNLSASTLWTLTVTSTDIQLSDGVTTVTATVPSRAGQWHLFEAAFDVHANPLTADWRIDGIAQTRLSKAVAATTMSGAWRFGDSSSVTQTLYWDDMVVSDSLADYPIGNGRVAGYWPTSDGTHTATSTHIVKGTTATPVGTAIVAGTTDAYQWIDGPTIDDTADFWNMQTVGATEYAEVNFTDSTFGRPPHMICTLISLSAATASGNTQKAVLYDGTTATDIYTLGTVGVSHPTLSYTGRRWATTPSSGAWTTAIFNLLRARWGYSNDATPDAYVDNILIEADFPDTSFPNRPRHRNRIIR